MQKTMQKNLQEITVSHFLYMSRWEELGVHRLIAQGLSARHLSRRPLSALMSGGCDIRNLSALPLKDIVPLLPSASPPSCHAAHNELEDLKALERTHAVLHECIRQDLCTGAQVSIRMEGGRQHDLVVGHVRPGVPMRKGVLMNWMSTSKVVAVIAIAQMYEAKQLHVRDLVAAHIPEFGCYGKEVCPQKKLLL